MDFCNLANVELKDLRRLMQTGGDGTRNISGAHLELLGHRGGGGQIDESAGCLLCRVHITTTSQSQNFNICIIKSQGKRRKHIPEASKAVIGRLGSDNSFPAVLLVVTFWHMNPNYGSLRLLLSMQMSSPSYQCHLSQSQRGHTVLTQACKSMIKTNYTFFSFWELSDLVWKVLTLFIFSLYSARGYWYFKSIGHSAGWVCAAMPVYRRHYSKKDICFYME